MTERQSQGKKIRHTKKLVIHHQPKIMAHNSPLTDEYDCSTNVVFLAAMLTRFPYHIEFEKELLKDHKKKNL